MLRLLSFYILNMQQDVVAQKLDTIYDFLLVMMKDTIKRFDKIDAKLAEHDAKFAEHDANFRHVSHTLNRILRIEDRVEVLEEDVKKHGIILKKSYR